MASSSGRPSLRQNSLHSGITRSAAERFLSRRPAHTEKGRASRRFMEPEGKVSGHMSIISKISLVSGYRALKRAA